MNSGTEIRVKQAMKIVHEKIANREGIADLSDRKSKPPRKIDPAANGFAVRVRGLGVILAIKPGALCNWIPGYISAAEVVRKIAATGDLIHGCDGKRTRQVFIPGIGRYRYYCFKAGQRAQLSPMAARAARPTSRSLDLFKQHAKADWNDDD